MPLLLSSKWISKWQELWTVIDGVPGWPKKRRQLFAKFLKVHWNTPWASCPGRCQAAKETPLWYLSNYDDITSSPHSRGQQMVCVICYLPRVLSKTSSAPQKMLRWKMNRWTHESRNESEGGSFQMTTTSACGYFINAYTSMHVWTSRTWFLHDIWDTVNIIGRLWFYALD